MTYSIHCKATPRGKRLRLWSSVVDAYITEPLTKGKMVTWLVEDERRDAERSIAERIGRAERTGTSSHYSDRALDDEWKTERCVCGWFHHQFVETERGTCGHCGEDKVHETHGQPCASGTGK